MRLHTAAGRSLALLMLLAGATPAAGQGRPVALPDFARASLEDLMKIQMTSASRKEQRAGDVPSAVFVVTADDIRRSGMRTLPELLRLVPGVQVAQINSSSWAVSIRGFNDQFANKLLVLVDGRSIYKRAFSGVFWDAEDLVLDDIERIEVIRGPGGAVWGANAVNGVVNIVTKSAASTQGALVHVEAGTFDRAQATLRYGGALGSAHYRLYSQVTGRGDTQLAAGTPDDDWRALTAGGRVDWTRGPSEWMLDSSVGGGAAHTTWLLPASGRPDLAPRTDVPVSFRQGSVLGRWTRHAADGSSLQVQSSFAMMTRVDFVPLDERSFDIDLQYHRWARDRHDVVVGGGYRVVNATTGENFAVSFAPSPINTAVLSAFLQDEIRLTDRVSLTVGSKVERATFADWGLQPAARVMWRVTDRQRAWAAASQALRTPSTADLALHYRAVVIPGQTPPLVIGAVGDPGYDVENFVSLEAGYRVELGAAAFIDLAAFHGRYGGLPVSTPLAPVLESVDGQAYIFAATRASNGLTAQTRGVEIAAHVTPVPGWRLDGSYSVFRLTPGDGALPTVPPTAPIDGNAPAAQWRLHSGVTLAPRTEIDASLFHVGRLERLGVAAYTRADARVDVRLTPHLSLAAVGRNLLAASHPEYTSVVVAATRVPRNFTMQLVWSY
jgi:iron complex outermembrane receptor protein